GGRASAGSDLSLTVTRGWCSEGFLLRGGQGSLGFGGRGAAGRGHVLEGSPVGGVAGLGGGRAEVGGDACAFPVAAGLRVDCFGDGDGYLQVGVHAESFAGVGAAAGALAGEGGSAELLQVVGELLAAGERGRAGEHVDRFGLAE